VEKLTLYPNGYININQNGEYTKHYYADAARIASKIGRGYNMPIRSNADNTQSENALEMMKNELGVLTGDSVDNITHSLSTINYLTGNGNTEDGLFFYHGNHLSSTQLITDINANISQAVLYTPWGSVIKEYKADWMLDTIPRYLFNAKELDEESGMYYYEARYYAPPTFISRDPHFERYPTLSPYNAFFNNPVRVTDPDGRDGKVTGSGTADDPYIITAVYFYDKSLKKSQRVGLEDAIGAFNNAGVIKIDDNGSESYVKYNLSAEKVDDISAAIESTAFETISGKTGYFGNRVGTKPMGENSKELGSASFSEINFNVPNINLAIYNYGFDRFRLNEGMAIHEIGHNLGGGIDGITSLMSYPTNTRTSGGVGTGINHYEYPNMKDIATYTQMIFDRRDRADDGRGRLRTAK
jgi:RHS repeat-associated protein